MRLDAPAQSTASPRGRVSPRLRCCAECGGPVRASGDFCASSCRRAFNNRRALRGAELYDLFMAHRFEPRLAAALHVWRLLNRLAARFRREDIAARAGRPSWRGPREILARNPALTATVMQRPAARERLRLEE